MGGRRDLQMNSCVPIVEGGLFLTGGNRESPFGKRGSQHLPQRMGGIQICKLYTGGCRVEAHLRQARSPWRWPLLGPKVYIKVGVGRTLTWLLNARFRSLDFIQEAAEDCGRLFELRNSPAAMLQEGQPRISTGRIEMERDWLGHGVHFCREVVV